MVSCDPYQTYKIPLKTDGQSIIEHNLVTIYLNFEWPDNGDENPNLLLHIFDKKSSPKPCKNEASMSYFQQNQSSLLVNSIHHHQQQNFGSTYQQQYYHHSSVINNDQPTTTTTITTGDHNDVSSTTTTTVVFSATQPPPPPPPSASSQAPVQQIKNEVKTQLSPIYRRQANSTSPPVVCSSTNPSYLSTQHVIQTPPSNLDTPSNLHTSPTMKTISPTSSTHLSNKPMMTHVIDLQSTPPTPVYPLSTSSTSPTFKAFVCTCLKPHLVHEHNCPTLTLVKQQSNTTLTAQTIVCRPPINRTIAQRAAVASQNRTNRSISMTTPAKEQGQPSLPFAISNIKTPDSLPHITTIISHPQQQQQQTNNTVPPKKTIVRQRSVNSLNSRQRKKRLIKQISLPNGTNQEQTSFYNQINLNDVKSQPLMSMIKEEHLTSPNPTIKLVSPFAIQTTVSNSDIDQTIDDVINGKVDIPINHHSPPPTPLTKLQPPRQPSSQLVWVQNGTVTTKTWLSPLYQKQQQTQQQQQQHHHQSVYDPIGSTLTHQDVVNIAQQVVFPTNTESNQGNTILPPASSQTVATPNPSNSKKRNRSKATTNPPLKRIRNRKPAPNRTQARPNSSSSSQIETQGRSNVTSPITPIHNLINKPLPWSNLPTPSSGSTTTTNTPILNSHPLLPSFDKNDSWQSQCVENVDSMLDEFQLVSIDQQRNYSTNHFDFDLSIDGFPSKTNERFTSSTPPPLLTLDNTRYSLTNTDKLSNSSSISNSRLVTGDVDVYDHFLNPYSSSIWQENQVTSSVSTPPDFQLHHFSLQPSIHPPLPLQQHQQQGTQQYYSSSQTTDEHFDSYNSQSQATKKYFK